MNARLSIRNQRGLGLIEIMVAVTIAAILMLGLVMIFMSGRSSFLMQEQVGRLQENGRYAFHLMTRELQNSGYRNNVWDPPQIGFALTNATTDGGGASPDTIEIQYEANKDCLGQYNTATQSIARPDGTTINVPAFYHKLTRFSIDATDLQLVYACSYGPVNGTLVQQINQPVADGIENLQIQYGEDLTGDLSVNQWVAAGNWTNFANVIAVRVALLLRTPEEFQVEADTQVHDLHGVQTVAANDRRLRQVYSGSISLRNLTL